MFITRGREFRTAFADLGELRAIVSRKIPIVALSATITYPMFKEVKESLYLKDEFVIAISPERLNLTFSVQPKLTIPELGNEIAKQLKEERKHILKQLYFAADIKNVLDYTKYCNKYYSRILLSLLDHMTSMFLDWLICIHEHLCQK